MSKSNHPRISVIIPVYNTERVLKQCLDSVLNQTFPDLEIIIVNDCTPDNSEDIILEYTQKDNRIVYVKNEKNIGLGATRNHGVGFAEGEFIAFVDSDDWLDLNTFELTIKAATNSNADMVLFRQYIYYHESKTAQPVKKLSKKLNIRRQDFTIQECPDIFQITASWSKIYKRDIILNNNIEFAPNLYYEDVPFSYKYYLNMNKAVLVDEPLYYYRQHSGTITRDGGKKIFDIFKIMEMAESIVFSQNPNPAIVKAYNRKIWEILLLLFLRINSALTTQYQNHLSGVRNNLQEGGKRFSRLLVKIKAYKFLYLITKSRYNLGHILFRLKGIFQC